MTESTPDTSSPQKPWDFHPALTEERLRFCARLLANARRDAVALAAYEMGDDSWSVGCRAYAFGKQRLKRAASARVHPWLRVMDDSHHFVFGGPVAAEPKLRFSPHRQCFGGRAAA